MRLVYPAVFIPFDDGDGYTVEFPDLPGCVTEGEDLGDAIYMAEDAAKHNISCSEVLQDALEKMALA